MPDRQGRGGTTRLAVYSRGFLTNRSLRAALAAAGYETGFGPIMRDPDAVAVWGDRPVAQRGHKAGLRRDLPVLVIEDAFVKGISPDGPMPVLGLTVDDGGFYPDASADTRLQRMLNTSAALGKAERHRAEAALAVFLRRKLSKYNDHVRPASDLLPEGFVLVVDQLPDDASIRLGGATRQTFADMLEAAKVTHPDTPIVIKRHPRAGADAGLSHFGPASLSDRVRFLDEGVAIADVLDKAAAVYVVTSQVGFEAVLRGMRPRVFGGAFYAGWGLTDDVLDLPARTAVHDRLSLFCRVMLDYPVWIDPYRREPTSFERVMDILSAHRRAFEIRQRSYAAYGISQWKRGTIRRFLGDVTFGKPDEGRTPVVWASKQALPEGPVLRLEDGFLRSVGLGADLVAARSLCLDDLGIYYDPARPSRLEALISASVDLPTDALARARRLRSAITAAGISKYNTGAGQVAVPPERRVILVPGQVEDDASILTGTTSVQTNQALLEAVRADNPDAWILYKPHPDVAAGLRKGAVAADVTRELCDAVIPDVPVTAAIDASDAVWTMTSLTGFEALLRGKPVTTFGQPFYAGWGLTDDRAEPVARRGAAVTLDQLVHAVLVDYPLYFDNETGTPCDPETVVWRLATSSAPARGTLARLQRRFARFAWVWR